MADIVVMGGGIFGLSVAWSCARRGAAVRLIERRRIGAGASGGLTGALFPHVPEHWNAKKAFQLGSLRMAGEWWAEAGRVAGRNPGYDRIGRIQPLADASAVSRARERATGAASLWGSAGRWDVLTAADAPGLALEGFSGHVVHDTLSARLNPRQACATLADALRATGAEVVEGRDAPPEQTGAVVWATGWEGLSDIRGATGRAAGSGVKGQAMLLAHDAGDAPMLLADGVYLVPQADGTLALGATSERDFDTPDSTDAQLDALHARAVALCPEIRAAPVIERWAGVRPRARSRAPMLGPWPGRPGHYIANGGFKIGFGMAPKAGEVMADLLLEGHDAIPPGFRVEDNL